MSGLRIFTSDTDSWNFVERKKDCPLLFLRMRSEVQSMTLFIDIRRVMNSQSIKSGENLCELFFGDEYDLHDFGKDLC